VVLIEETLLFNQFSFHKQKIAFMRGSMRAYRDRLIGQGHQVIYIEAHQPEADIRQWLLASIDKGLSALYLIDPVDYWIERRITRYAQNIELNWHDTPAFLNTKEDLSSFFKPTKKKFFQTSFYKSERQKRGILIEQGGPAGGQWTYDAENRRKFPKNASVPEVNWPEETTYHQEARTYVAEYFENNLGALDNEITYPLDHQAAELWLKDFLKYRFEYFGHYEDALVAHEHILHHSLLSPLINVGLLCPNQVLDQVLSYAKNASIPLNSTEGLVRQIMGWREFIRGVYQVKGSQERITNFWAHKRKIPESFYSGTTGLFPVDSVIKKLNKTGYAHHIERLMVMGNIMVLCEFDPDEVYRWFMELFIDAYDWVMVPNVYGMSLFADGGVMSTKPYISGSNYLMKMSDYPKGPWQDTWDGLFWRFMDKHRDFFLSNPRLAMLVRSLDKMKPETLERHLFNAQKFLDQLDAELSSETTKN
jgi:deoxyribodipyrimidine photolyase-related protein